MRATRCDDDTVDVAAPGAWETTATAAITSSTDKPAPQCNITRIGRYLIEGVLGSGAMGIVYCARDPSLGRVVALKVIGSRSDERAAPRLMQEAVAIARVPHPNVIHVYDVGRDPEGLVYIAMEHVEGLTLGRWLEERPRNTHEILDVFVEAARGLAAAHAAGVVHRDFKPDNVIVGRDGRPGPRLRPRAGRRQSPRSAARPRRRARQRPVHGHERRPLRNSRR